MSPKDSEGRVFDFHSLRHTCGSWAAQGGASPKAIQTLMRHSQITLTLDTYGHLLPGEEVETVGRMAGFDEDETQAATPAPWTQRQTVATLWATRARKRAGVGGQARRGAMMVGVATSPEASEKQVVNATRRNLTHLVA